MASKNIQPASYVKGMDILDIFFILSKNTPDNIIWLYTLCAFIHYIRCCKPIEINCFANQNSSFVCSLWKEQVNPNLYELFHDCIK